MTDQELKNLVASLAISQAKTDEQMKKTDEQMKRNEAKLTKMGVLLGNISNNQVEQNGSLDKKRLLQDNECLEKISGFRENF